MQAYDLYKYISNDTTGNKRLRMEITPHAHTPISALMAASHIRGGHPRRELNMAKHVNRFGHVTADEMKEILQSAQDVDHAKLRDACPICAAAGRPSMRKKESTTHINEAFNGEVQVDFLHARIHGE